MVKEEFDLLPPPARVRAQNTGGSSLLEDQRPPALSKLVNRQGGRNVDPVAGNQSIFGSMKFVGTAVAETAIPRIKLSWLKEIKEGGVAKSTFAFVVTYTFVIGSAIAFLALFSIWQPFWGWGDSVFPSLSGKTDISLYQGITAGGIIAFLYLFDFWYAIRPVKIAGFALFVVACLLGMSAAILAVDDNGAAPLGVFAVVVPIVLGGMKLVLFKNVDSLWYLFSIFCALQTIAFGVVSLWIIWMFTYDKRWSKNELDKEYADYVGCNLTEITNDVNQTTTTPCNQAFLAWAAPGLLATYSFVFANILVIIIRVEARRRVLLRSQKVEPIAQLYIFVLIFGFLATWVIASILASNFISLSDTLLYFGLVAMVKAVAVATATFGVDYMRTYLSSSPLGIKVIELADSDWSRAFGVFVLTPVFILYLMLSFFIQSIRRYTPLGKPLHGTEEKQLHFQIESQKYFEALKNWEWGSVLLKLMWIGVFWIIVVIGIGRLVNVFLSWLSGELAGLSLGVTTAVFFLAGIVMFLLPPVPGLPIYFCGGVVLSKTAEQSGWSFIMAALYSILICTLLKGTAIVLQQKVIGQIIGAKSVYIRSLVNINSLELRAMKKIMAVPGFSIPKIAVLVGGPDWPTSVLTGIMRLSLWQMLLGSIPVIITIVPVCFAGAVILKGSEGIYGVLNPVLLTLSVIIQLTPFFIAVHYIAKAAIVYKDELDQEPLDKEVEEYDKEKELSKKWSFVLNKWERLATPVKALHVVMCILTVISNITLWIAGNECFVPFEVTDTIEETLDGNVTNLVILPFGGIMLLLAVIPWAYLFIFSQVQGQRIKKRIRDNTPLPEGENLEELSFEFFNVSFFSAKNLRILLANQSLASQSFEHINPVKVIDDDDVVDAEDDDGDEVIA